MSQVPIHQASILTRILQEIPEINDEIRDFKTQAKRAIYAGNQKKFDELVQKGL